MWSTQTGEGDEQKDGRGYDRALDVPSWGSGSFRRSD